jgi:FtsP/CotA-like multicopper oxidase with cupredoxin domain
MHTNTLVLHQRFLNTRRWAIALLAVLALTLSVASAAHADPLTPPNCAGSHPTSFDLYAKPGTLTLADGTTVNIWGYAANSGDPAQVPGPTLIVCEGDNVTITLHNGLGEVSSLAVHGQTLPSDMVGANDGASKDYAFTAHAGTFVYQAGLTVNGPKQAALGLYGGLVVYPATSGQAYTPTATNASTSFDSEALLLLSEIDPALNADPINFDMKLYAPKYWLINGKSYPQTEPITATAGSHVLLRYANAGFEEHSMGLLGLDQSIIAANGYLLPSSFGVVAETVPPAGTMDTIVTMPDSGGQYALFDGNQHIDNSGAAGLGGMLTFIGVPVVVPTPPVNQAPTVNAGTEQVITLPSSATLAGTATDDGLPNPPAALTTAWSMVSGSGVVTFTDPSALNTTADFSAAGTYVLRLTADDSALTASSDVTITVNPELPVNQAPVVNAGADQIITLPSAATLAGTATDDGLPNPPAVLTTTWSTVSGSGVVTFTDPSALNTSASFSVADTYVLRLTAGDGALTASSDVTITVSADPPPTVSITDPASAATVSGTLTITATAADTAPGTVTQVEFFVDNVSIGIDTNGSDGWSASWDSTLVADGPHTLTAVATDDAAQITTSATVDITVGNIVVAAPQAVIVPQPIAIVPKDQPIPIDVQPAQ